jgi:hypothetical protein
MPDPCTEPLAKYRQPKNKIEILKNILFIASALHHKLTKIVAKIVSKCPSMYHCS